MVAVVIPFLLLNVKKLDIFMANFKLQTEKSNAV